MPQCHIYIYIDYKFFIEVFHQGSHKALSMYCTIFEKFFKEPLVEIQFEKNGGEKNNFSRVS